MGLIRIKDLQCLINAIQFISWKKDKVTDDARKNRYIIGSLCVSMIDSIKNIR